ncbi:MAG: hypothetical protein RJA22_2890 [Verrucomicrobiota bacterium]|jgi:hypothetical protein
MSPGLQRALADVVLAVHFAFAAFIVAGLVLTWVGRLRRWHWVGNPWFRGAHLLAMGYVAAEAVLGVDCPLTTLENWLRHGAGQAGHGESCVQHWLQRLLFFDASPVLFTVLYVVVFGLIVATLRWAPVRWPRRAA